MNKSSNNKNKGSARRAPKQSKSVKKDTKVNFGSNKRSSAPVSQGLVSTMSKPQTRNLANGNILVRHREFVADLNGSVEFLIQRSPHINAGSRVLFPWLASIANNYESYIFNSLIFRYESTCNTTTSGSVVLAIDYDPDDQFPESKQELMDFSSSVRCNPWLSCEHKSLKGDLNKRKTYFVRNAGVPAGAERNTYDVGTLYVGTQGQATASSIGELYVEYEVILQTPQIGIISLGNALYADLTGTTNPNAFQNRNGSLSNTDIIVTFVTPYTWQFLFLSPFQGHASFKMVGTGLSLPMITAPTITTGSKTQENDFAGTSTSSIDIYDINMLPSGIFQVTIVNTGLSFNEVLFTQARVTIA